MTTSAPIGVLLLAYGTPETLDDVEPYYTHIRRGRPPTSELLDDLRDRYIRVGGRTPLRDITFSLAEQVQRTLDAKSPSQFKVYVGMKHWHPYIGAVVPQIAADGVQQLIAIALAPHYSQYSIGGYLRAIESAQQSLPEPMALTFVPRWHDHPLFRSFIADRIRRAIQQFPVEKRDQVVVLFSAHSLPKRILGDGDPYPAELLDSAAGVATLLDLPTWTFAYQSASPTGEPWLGPDILKALEDLAAQGTLNVVSVPIGFVADHLEVLYDIDIEAQETAQALGMTLVRVAMPNADPAFAALLADVVQQNVPAMV